MEQDKRNIEILNDLNYRLTLWLYRKHTADLTDGLEVNNVFSITECDKMINAIYEEIEYMQGNDYE